MIRLLTAIAAGAAAMFLLDPRQGARRRALLRERTVGAAHRLERIAGARGENLLDRGRGLVAEATRALRRDRAGDEQLEARVRAKLGRAASHPHAIGTRVEERTLVLEGIAPAGEIDAIVAAASTVRGIDRVDNRLRAGDPGRTAPKRGRRAAATLEAGNGLDGAG